MNDYRQRATENKKVLFLVFVYNIPKLHFFGFFFKGESEAVLRWGGTNAQLYSQSRVLVGLTVMQL